LERLIKGRRKIIYKPKVFIAIPTGGTIRAELAMFLLHLDKHYKTTVSFTYQGEVASNRNKLIEQFLLTDYKWLLFLDNDILPPSNVLDMTRNNVEVCSGVYYQWILDRALPTIYRIKDNHYQALDDVPYNTLIEIDGAGAGCLLINRVVFETIDKPYFKIEYDDKGYISTGHDLYFCDKVREAGISMYADTRMLCSHYKTIELKEGGE